MSLFLRDLALAHQTREGYYPGSVAYVNRNPGNIRGGPPTDRNGFTIYKTYEDGFAALEGDLRTKICGGSRHIDYSKNPTMLTYVKIYAPQDDGNDPNGYCQFLCKRLAMYNIHPSTPLTLLCQLVNRQISRIPTVSDPIPQEIIQPPAQRLQTAETALGWTKNPVRVFQLTNMINRLKKMLGFA